MLILIMWFVQGILQRLEITREQTDVGWVCVDQRPARATLTSLVNKWTHVYASYLESRVRSLSTTGGRSITSCVSCGCAGVSWSVSVNVCVSE